MRGFGEGFAAVVFYGGVSLKSEEVCAAQKARRNCGSVCHATGVGGVLTAGRALRGAKRIVN